METHNFNIKPVKPCRHTLPNFDDIHTKGIHASKLTCLEEICKHLKDDKVSLFSCILINRSWCEMAIPILWSRPFENPMYGNHLTIFWTYVSCLPAEDKQRLSNKGIKLSNPNRKPLFDYP